MTRNRIINNILIYSAFILIIFFIVIFIFSHNNFTSIKKNFITPSPIQYSMAKVIRIIDGDTVEIDSKRLVRYIGMNTPELNILTNKKAECYSQEAKNRNSELVEGKIVKLIKDISETDKYNRLLRYVYMNDQLVNKQLVTEGYAKTMPIRPDINHAQEFFQEEKLAKLNKVGLWKVCY
ncbi:MAG: thermonuclease family protein [bacterium]|nr:thermonuclease family protein [bacterium]